MGRQWLNIVERLVNQSHMICNDDNNSFIEKKSKLFALLTFAIVGGFAMPEKYSA